MLHRGGSAVGSGKSCNNDTFIKYVVNCNSISNGRSKIPSIKKSVFVSGLVTKKKPGVSPGENGIPRLGKLSNYHTFNTRLAPTAVVVRK